MKVLFFTVLALLIAGAYFLLNTLDTRSKAQAERIHTLERTATRLGTIWEFSKFLKKTFPEKVRGPEDKVAYFIETHGLDEGLIEYYGLKQDLLFLASQNH